MALPRLNNDVNYNLVIPSTNKEIQYRPFLMKEEKTLLTAMESKNNKVIFNSLLDTIKSCIKDDIKVNTLTSFDIEYMFLQIRSKSVGETAKVGVSCTKCQHLNEIEIKLDDIKIDIPDIDKIINLDDNIKLEVDWPSFNDLIKSDIIEEGDITTDKIFGMMQHCFRAVITDDERINLKDVSKQELQDFIDSMNAGQFAKIKDFIENIPKLQHKIDFECSGCNQKETQVLEGVSNFLG